MNYNIALPLSFIGMVAVLVGLFVDDVMWFGFSIIIMGLSLGYIFDIKQKEKVKQ